MGGAGAAEPDGIGPAIVQITVLGPVSIAFGEDLSRVITRRHDRLAFAYLVLHRTRPVGPDELADVLWPAGPTSSWKTAIRGVVHRLRQTLESIGLDGAHLHLSSGNLQFRFPDPTEVDLEFAEQCVGRAEDEGTADPVGAIRHAKTAVAHLDRPFLADCGGTWVETEQRRITDLSRRATLLVASNALASGSHEVALRAAESVLATDPWEEAAHRIVIAAHDARHDRAAALIAYRRCRRTLREEFGVSPSPETEAAYLEVLTSDRTALKSAAVRLPFVGRATECAELAAAWSRVTDGEAEAILVCGEPGVGKSRLAHEMARSFEAVGAVVLQGRLDESPRASLGPFTDAFRVHAARSGPDRRARLQQAAPGLWDLVVGPGGPFSTRTDQSAANNHEIQRELFAEVVAWLSVVAHDGPVVFVIDDIEWSSASTLQCLRHVLSDAHDLRLLVIGTSSPQREAPSVAWTALVQHPSVRRLPLAGLTETDVSDLLCEVFDYEIRPGAARSAAIITAATSGNALYVTEVIRQLGSDVRAGAGSLRAVPIDDTTVTDAVSMALGGLVAQRVDGLSRPARRVLEIMAVAGNGVPLELFRAAHPDIEQLESIVMQLSQLDFIESDRDLIDFRHDIVRELVVAGLGEETVGSMHRDLAFGAEALDGLTALQRQATHWSKAAGLGREEALKAVRACGEAGRYFADRADFGQSASSYAAALDALALADPTESLGSQWCDLLIAQGEALHASGDPEFVGVLSRAISVARRIDDPSRIARAALALEEWGMPRSVLGDEGAHVRVLRDALAGLPEGDLAIRARVHSALAMELRWSATPEIATASMQEAFSLARRSGDAMARATTLMCRAGLGGSAPAEALDDAAELHRLGNELDHKPSICTAAVVSIDALVRMGMIGRALDELARLERVTERLPLSYFSWVAATRRAGIQALTGEPSESLDTMADARRLGTAIGIDPAIIFAGELALRLAVGLERGDPTDAVDALEGLGDSVGRHCSWHASMAAGYAEMGDHRAQEHLDEVMDLVDSLRDDELGLAALVNGARAAARLGDARASAFSRLLDVHAGELNWSSCVSFGPIDLARAWVAIATGDRDLAVSLTASASDLCLRGGAVTWKRSIDDENRRILTGRDSGEG